MQKWKLVVSIWVDFSGTVEKEELSAPTKMDRIKKRETK